MKKNIKGFFLAETIIMIALVTTVVAFLYPNVSKLYENYNNRVKYYDQVEDLYTLRAIEKYLEKEKTAELKEAVEKLTDTNKKENIYNLLGEQIDELENLYIAKYMGTPSDEDYEFNKYLKRLKKTTNSQTAYRLIGVFKDGRYASIKILVGAI